MKYKWAIVIVDFDKSIGSEIHGIRPAIIISDEFFNQRMAVVTVLPVTSRKQNRKIRMNEALLEKGIANLDKDSIIEAHQIVTISKIRIGKLIGHVDDPNIQKSINNAIKLHLNL